MTVAVDIAEAAWREARKAHAYAVTDRDLAEARIASTRARLNEADRALTLAMTAAEPERAAA